MAIKNLQFIVTVGVDVPDDWECPTAGTDAIESVVGGAVYNSKAELASQLDAHDIDSVSVVFETITN